MRTESLVGQTFGRLIAIERIRKNGVTTYRCGCLCGNQCRIRYSNLVGRNTRSCGCLKQESLHRRKQSDETIRLSDMIRYYRRNAKLRDVKWELDRDTFRFFVTQACHYCGWNKDWVGVDRVDNTQGYNIVNCVGCCRWCNWGKNERSMAEFDEWVRRLYERRIHNSR